ncbi:hypothetical protein, partial [Pseudomonas sp. zfem002]|uniref:hypothetical protein n=1 Tax=Pseudomonas sp. zfem002 TaxID=3078197 RepID=UPI0029282816
MLVRLDTESSPTASPRCIAEKTKADNSNPTGHGALQQMWEQLSSRTFLKTIPPDIASPATQLSGVAGENPAQYFSPGAFSGSG